MAAKIFIAGGVSWDTVIQLGRFPEPRQQMLFARESYGAVGATSSGKALNLATLGHRVTLAAQLGPDRFGDALRDRFKEAGIRLLELPDTVTEQHTNLMNPQGERISIFAVQRTFSPPVDPSDFEGAVAKADVVVLDIINWSRGLIPLVKELGKPVWCDLHDYDGLNPYHRDYLEAADVVFGSAEALPDPERFGAELIAQGKQLVVLTNGVEGAVAFTGGARTEVPSVSAFGMADTNGAGDAFLAGYLHGHLRGQGVAACLELASLTAALCVASRELVHRELTPERLAELHGRYLCGALPRCPVVNVPPRGDQLTARMTPPDPR